MNRLVFNVFKIIMLSIILVFAFDMIGYLYKALILDQRMKNLMAEMQRTVAENNYLPEGAYATYSTLMKQIATGLNGNDANSFVGTADKGDEALFLNYKDDAQGIPDSVKAALQGQSLIGYGSSGARLLMNMEKPGRYGEIMVVQAAVCVRQPTWRFTTSGDGTNRHNMANWTNSDNDNSIFTKTAVFTYTYYVPCMNYSKTQTD